MSLARVVFFSALSFVGGIILSSFTDIDQLVLLVVFILAVFLITVFWKRWRLMVLGIFILLLCLGVWRYQAAQGSRAEDDVAPFWGKEVNWIVRIAEEPDAGELVVQPENIKGRVKLHVPIYPEYNYGDVLSMKGVVEEPPMLEDFDYPAFLASKEVYGTVFRPRLELIEEGKPSLLYSIKGRFREVVNKYLPPPHSELLSAMLLGDKAGMSDSLKEKLNKAGVRHITAVSGMHVAILSGIVLSLLLGLGLWRSHATLLATVFIGLFVVLTGFQASAVRAGLMGGLVLFSQNMGRMNVGTRTLVFVAAFMLALNPFLIKDVGFQLSFLAVLGIILLLPFLREVLSFVPTAFQIRDVLGMTISAQVFTLPLLIWHFGGFSIVSVLTNILIVPLLPFILGLGFLFIVAGAVWSGFGYLLFLPVFFLLDYVSRVVEIADKVPGAFLVSSHFTWLVLFLLYLLGYLAWRRQRKHIF